MDGSVPPESAHAAGLAVVHLDAACVVLDKPAGLLCVPGRGPDKQDCLALRVQAVWPEARVVHRLDMGTSGLWLMARGLDPALPAMRAHGVPGLIDWLCGRASREEAVGRGQADTRHYAKRQSTFARHQLPDFRFTAPHDAAKAALALARGAGAP